MNTRLVSGEHIQWYRRLTHLGFVHLMEDVPNFRVGDATLDDDPWSPAKRYVALVRERESYEQRGDMFWDDIKT